MISEVASDGVLEATYDWLCRRRINYPTDTDIWDLRFKRPGEKGGIQRDLLNDTYTFSPLSRVTNRDGETMAIWLARDALILKAMTIFLEKHLPVSRNCTHIRGNGGQKATIRRAYRAFRANSFVLRTDVRSFYASIEHHLLLDKLANHIKDRPLLNLMWQYMHRTVTSGGNFTEIERGISRGCPLSPLIGAFFLHELDVTMEQLGLFYVRFMDDILVLAPTRWKLRRAVRTLSQTLESLQLEKHPDKTFIGRTEKGFDFLGYHFGMDRLRVAGKTLENFVERANQHYEQKQTEPEGSAALGSYVRRWISWAGGGLGFIPLLCDGPVSLLFFCARS